MTLLSLSSSRRSRTTATGRTLDLVCLRLERGRFSRRRPILVSRRTSSSKLLRKPRLTRPKTRNHPSRAVGSVVVAPDGTTPYQAKPRGPHHPGLPNQPSPRRSSKSSSQACSWTSQTSLMPPIDRSRRDLSIGGIRLVWEVQEHG